MVRVKIIDIDLIRRFGSAETKMNFEAAISLQEKGKVKILDIQSENEFFYIDEDGKQELKPKENKKIPGPNDPIFPQIKV